MKKLRVAIGSCTLAGRGGFALPAAMIVLIVITILGLGYLALGFQERSLALKEVRRGQAFFLAEAGRQRTYYKLSITEAWPALPSQLYRDEPLGEGTYSVTFTNKTPTSVVFLASGTVRDVTRTVRVSLEKL